MQHQLFRIRFTELNEIFAVMSLRSFVTGMIGMFVPIYMYTIGFPLSDIFLLHVYMFSAELAFEYVAARIISRLGPKHAIAISMPFLVAHFWMLSTVKAYGWPIWLIAVMGGISFALYWEGYNYDFSRSKTKGGVTKDISKLYIMLAILGAIAPFVGGSIATYYGFGVLYTIVLVMLLLVFLPLIWFKEKHIARNFRLSRMSNLGAISRDLISYGGSGMEASVAITVWPLFVFAIVGTAQKVGFITSIALVLTIMVTYIVGKRVNNHNRHKYIQAGGLMDGVIYMLVIFVDSFGQVLSLNFARSLVGSLRSAPFISEYYMHADEQSRAEYIYTMESAIDFFRICMFGMLYLLTMAFPDAWVLVVGLAFGAAGSWMTSLMPRAKCELPYCSANKTIKFIPKLRPKNATS